MSWRCAPGVVVEFLDDEAVAYSTADARLHRLNSFAAQYWKQLMDDEGAAKPPADPVGATELEAFAVELAAVGLIVRDDAPRHAH